MNPRRAVLRAGAAGLASALAAGAGPFAQAQPAPGMVRRIGLLLPRSSGPLQRATAAVRAGIEESFRHERGALVVDIYELDDTARQLAAAYRGMAERGTGMALGPLTRAGMAALEQIGPVPLPTLALNQPESGRPLPPNVLGFSLSAEAEARQMADEAQRVLGPAATRAIIVSATSQAARRAAAAFGARWQELGGDASARLELEPAGLYRFRPQVRRQSGDLWFLSMGTDLAVPACTLIGQRVPVFGTSLMSTGGPANPTRVPELDGVRVLDMPALLQPSSVTRMGYASAPGNYPVDMQRLYAFGIDALRVARSLYDGQTIDRLNGLTGTLTFDQSTPVIGRTAQLARYQDGAPVAA